MTNTAFGNEEDIIQNLSGVINSYLLENKPINFIVKHYFYAKCLVAELAKANIPYHVFYLGSGVRHITTNLDELPTKQPTLPVDRAPALTDQEKRELWLRTFGTAKIRAIVILDAIKDNPAVAQLFTNPPKLSISSVGAALGHLHKKVNWLQVKPAWIAEDKQNRFFWYAV